jgi:hypothetical protein
MPNWLDIVDGVNLLARAEMIIGAVNAARHTSTRNPNQPGGIVELRVNRAGCFSGREVQGILRDHGVLTWGGRTTSDWFVLYIKRSQAAWAVSVLQGRGVDNLQTDPPLAPTPPPTTARTLWKDKPRR